MDSCRIYLYFYPVRDLIQVRFYTVNTGQLRTGAWDTTWRTLPNVLLERPHHGTWTCYYDGGKVAVPHAHLLVVPVACRHRLHKTTKKDMHSDWAYISWQYSNGQDVRTSQRPMVFKPAFAKRVEAALLKSNNDVQSIEAQAATLLILSKCLKDYPPQQVLYDDRIQRVIQHMRAHLHEDLDRDSLAHICHLSPTRFHDVFVEACGVAPMRYVTRLRLQRAQSLLRESDDSMAQIADACGFASQAYFNRVFKKSFGQSPGAYRQILIAE